MKATLLILFYLLNFTYFIQVSFSQTTCSGPMLVSADNSTNNSQAQIDDNTIVWNAFGRIYKNDGSGPVLVSTGLLSNNSHPQIDGNTIVWVGFSGTIQQIYRMMALGQN